MSKLILGIELGSTRIKSVLINEEGKIISQGAYNWENSLVDGLWSYSLEEVELGLQSSYQDLVKNYGKEITKIDSIGISAMMHGYLAFDKDFNLLVPFRTWRNTNTKQASEELSKLLDFNMPQRWSATHFYQAILNNEKHVNKVAYLTTLAGYVHYLLTGKFVLGIGDASGMFPIKDNKYDVDRLLKYNKNLADHGLFIKLEDLLPEILIAGDDAGVLTKEGALLIDPTGTLQEGSLCCPPEGDAGTGMVCTNSINERSGNVSAGTSAFLMIVLEKALSKPYPQIDIVTTPLGKDVAMVHVNNCTSEINSWVNVFNESLNLFGFKVSSNELYTKLFETSLNGDDKTGDLFTSSLLSGEPVIGIDKGKLVISRDENGKLSLNNLMQSLIYSSLASLAIGNEILKKENVKVDLVYGHGGFFKTPIVGQKAMSAALDCPIATLESAGEGGAYGIAILALYLLMKDKYETFNIFLKDFYKNNKQTIIKCDEKEKAKFDYFLNNFKNNLKSIGDLTINKSSKK